MLVAWASEETEASNRRVRNYGCPFLPRSHGVMPVDHTWTHVTFGFVGVQCVLAMGADRVIIPEGDEKEKIDSLDGIADLADPIYI